MEAGIPSGNWTIEYTIEPEKYWDEIYTILNKAIDKTDGEYTLEDIKTLLSNRLGLLWLVRTQNCIQAVFITQIHDYPSKKIGTVSHAAGESLHIWKDVVYVFERYFRENNCDFFDITGRRGWVKVYQPAGFKEKYVNIRKNLNG